MAPAAQILADLGSAAVRQRLDGPFTVWVSARALDRAGAGSTPIAVLRRLFPRTTLRRALATPFFRGIGHSRLYYTGIAQAAVLLGVHNARAAAFSVPLAQIIARPALRRARLALGAFASLRRGRPISVDAIADDLQVDRTTVFRWLRITRWPRRRRIALQPGRITPGTLRWLRASRPGPYLIVKRRGHLRLARQLPNALVTKYTVANRRALARRLRTARPAPPATRAPRGTPTGQYPSSSRVPLARGSALLPGRLPSPLSAEEAGSRFGQLRTSIAGGRFHAL